LRRERSRLAVRAGDWSDALALADADAPKAALAVAAAEAETEPARALRLTRQAWRDDPSLTPAALAYATRLRAAGREKRALTVIRHSWSIAPQPDLAAFALKPVSDPLERAQAARRLTEANPDHIESRLLLARTALEAGLTGEARRHAESAVAMGVDQRRLWLLLAEIEEAEGGETEAGRLAQRDALRRAATAEPDPVWRCDACHTAHASWHPSCPDCFTVGSLRWSTGPVETARVLQHQDQTLLISSG
jgi:HemY protein